MKSVNIKSDLAVLARRYLRGPPLSGADFAALNWKQYFAYVSVATNSNLMLDRKNRGLVQLNRPNTVLFETKEPLSH